MNLKLNLQSHKNQLTIHRMMYEYFCLNKILRLYCESFCLNRFLHCTYCTMNTHNMYNQIINSDK